MKERKETIDLKTANMVSIVIFVASTVVCLGAQFAVWGCDKDVLLETLSSSFPGSLLFFVALVAGIVVHELVHGITWACFAPSGFKSISFGVIWKMLTPYCHCDEPLLVKHYMAGAGMPLVVLGIIPSVVGVAVNSLALNLFGIIFIASAAGDILVMWRLRKEAACNTVLDHPSEAGYLVYEPDDE